MSAPTPPEDRDPLDPLLDRWARETPPAPESVRPEVWRRIALGERAGAAPGWWERMHAAFARPSFASAFVVACVLLGLFLAEARSSRLQAEYSAQLAHSYLRMIDPLLGETDLPASSVPPAGPKP